MNWYVAAFKKYADFNGRARRMEYWMFTLVNAVVGIALSVISYITDSGLWTAIYIVYALAIIIPGLAVTVRRLHDTNRSGWWWFIGLIPIIGSIILLIFLVSDSQYGENRFGPNPKGIGNATDTTETAI